MILICMKPIVVTLDTVHLLGVETTMSLLPTGSRRV
jgi:hypothetical protein